MSERVAESRVIWDDETSPLSPAPQTPSVDWGGEPTGMLGAPMKSEGSLTAAVQMIAKPLTAGVQRGLAAFDPLTALMRGREPLGPEDIEARKGAAELMVPQTATDVALLAATPALRGLSPLLAKSPLAQRALTGAGAITAGGAASRADVGEWAPGVKQGAVVAGVGAIPAVGGYLWRSTPWGSRQVMQSMEREALDVAGGLSPAFKGVEPANLYREAVVFPRELQARFSRIYEAGIQAAANKAPGNVVTSPHLMEVWQHIPKNMAGNLKRAQLAPIGGKFTIEQSAELLRIARLGAYKGPKLALEKAGKSNVVATYKAALEDVYRKSNLPPEAAEILEGTRIMHGVNKGLAAIFKDSGALTPGVLGPTFNPNAALDYMEKAGDALRKRAGTEGYAVLHEALSRGGKLGERHDLGIKELVPGILERSIVITRSILKHIGITPIKLAGTRPQPFTPGPAAETAIGLFGGQAFRGKHGREGPAQ